MCLIFGLLDRLSQLLVRPQLLTHTLSLTSCRSLAWISWDMLQLLQLGLAVNQPGYCLSCIWRLPLVEVLATAVFFCGIRQYQLCCSVA